MNDEIKTPSILSMDNTKLIAMVKEDIKQKHQIDLGALLGSVDKNLLTDQHYKDIADIYGVTKKEIESSIKSMAAAESITAELGSYPKDEYEFVALQLEKWNTKMTFQNEFTIKTPYDLRDGSKPIELHELASLDAESQQRIILADPKTFGVDRMLERLRFQNRKLKLLYHKDRAIEHALRFWMNNRRDDLSATTVSKLVYGGAVVRDHAEAEWDRYVNAITAVNQAETKTVIKHFIWQVKRKMFNLPVTYHMMLVFKGKQEAGKSTMAKELCKPVKDFFASTNFANITDSRSHSIWSNYVLFFDEMGRSTTSNLEDIKRIITEDSFTSRIMNTNSDTIVKNRATCCGTTNKDLARLIFDDTGMRRFFQVECKDLLDWSVTTKIDFNLLWRSVDEQADTPLMADTDTLTNIRRVQNSKRQITMLELWLRERKHTQYIEEKVMAQSFYEEYVEFEKERNNGKCETNITKFGRDIKDVVKLVDGIEFTATRGGKGNVYKLTYTQNTDLGE